MRINQYISASGMCSRREADKWLMAKKVKINGKMAAVGTEVKPGDVVTVNGVRVQQKRKHVYLMLNKPAGITCTTERHIRGNIIDFIGHKERIFPIGRLDKDSEGLILLTSDGDIVNRILRKENNHFKVYRVQVNKAINGDFIKAMSEGVTIFNPVQKKHVKTLPCKVKQLKKDTFEIVLSQGLNRQIRRMCEVLGYEVVALKRTQIMNLKLNDLNVGKWRNLTELEVQNLLKSLNDK